MAKKKQVCTRKPEQSEAGSAAQAESTLQAGRSLWYVGIVAALLGLCLYANTLGNRYCYDDSSVITNNALVKGGIQNIGVFFASEYRSGYHKRNRAGNLYRPLALSLFALQWQLLPEAPWFYHANNVLLYGLTGWLLWVTWRRILKKHPPELTALGVLLFMAHPVHTEVVANIKSLDVLLTLLFGTAALYGLWRYVDEQRPLQLAGALASYALALFSKEDAIVYLGVFPLTLWFFSEKKLVDILKLSAWFLLPAGVFLLARAWAFSGAYEEPTKSAMTNFIVLAPNMMSRLASAFSMCWRYLAVLVLPHPLMCDLSYTQVRPVTFADWRALAGFAAFAAMAVWALRQAWWRRSFPAFAILLFLATFLLASNIFYLISTSYAERALYLPSLGFSFALAWALTRLFPAGLSGGRQRAFLWAAAGILLMLYGAKTVTRNFDWQNSFVLFDADIRVSPNSTLLMHNYGLQCLYKGYDKNTGLVTDPAMLQKSIDLFTGVIKVFPNSYETLAQRAIAYERLKKYDLAIADYEKTVSVEPDNSQALYSLGYLYRNVRNQPEKAVDYYSRAVTVAPQLVKARRNLGATLASLGRYSEAIEQLKEGLKYAPDDLLMNQYIAKAYMDMGKPDLGKPFEEKAGTLKKMIEGASAEHADTKD